MEPQSNNDRGKFIGIVRPLRQEDISMLKPILETWLIDPDTDRLLIDEVEEDIQFMQGSLRGENKREYLVAETDDGNVIGMIGLSPLKLPLGQFAQTDKPVELVNAYVNADYRAGMGVGTSLVNRLTERAIERGFTEVLLDSGPRHEKTAWGFYDKQPGFERIGLAKALYGPGRDAPVWHKLLI